MYLLRIVVWIDSENIVFPSQIYGVTLFPTLFFSACFNDFHFTVMLIWIEVNPPIREA